ncbi:MAG: Hpt domain-containing protein [Anaerolineales bacterium]
MNTDSVIELQTFESLRESIGTDFIKVLVNEYLDEAPLLLSKLENALAQKDCDLFRRSAHSLKSTSYTFGALQFGASAMELEAMGREAKLDTAPEKLRSLINDFEAVQIALQELCNG